MVRKKLSARERKRRARRSAHNSHLKKTYGVTIQDYDKVLAAQGGVCAICKGGTSKNFFAYEHNHRNGNWRGLACARCNSILARAMDRVEVLEAAVAYMKDDGATVRRILDA